jgi:site-specific recombinase XerD
VKLEQILEQQKHFLQDYERRGKSKNSLKCYRLDFTIFNAFLALMQKHETAQNNIDHFNAGFLESFDSYLRQKYKNLNSVNRKLQTLRLYYDFLKNKGLCDHNPMAKLKPSAKVLYPPTFHPQTHMEYIQTYLHLL